MENASGLVLWVQEWLHLAIGDAVVFVQLLVVWDESGIAG